MSLMALKRGFEKHAKIWGGLLVAAGGARKAIEVFSATRHAFNRKVS